MRMTAREGLAGLEVWVGGGARVEQPGCWVREGAPRGGMGPREGGGIRDEEEEEKEEEEEGGRGRREGRAAGRGGGAMRFEDEMEGADGLFDEEGDAGGLAERLRDGTGSSMEVEVALGVVCSSSELELTLLSSWIMGGGGGGMAALSAVAFWVVESPSFSDSGAPSWLLVVFSAFFAGG